MIALYRDFIAADDELEIALLDADYHDHAKATWASARLQELRGVPPLRVALDPAPVPRTGWLLMMLLPMAVRIPTDEAGLLIDRLVRRRNAGPGIWRPCDREIIAWACTLPGAEPLMQTEELLRSAGLWIPPNAVPPDPLGLPERARQHAQAGRTGNLALGLPDRPALAPSAPRAEDIMTLQDQLNIQHRDLLFI
ncbi:hypothetical protein DB346_23705 [Verrucomicrobia bacterium LW23]|nr:hypothetical protein DB346_23705 [Verrucomicrobia bacterium LW23]